MPEEGIPSRLERAVAGRSLAVPVRIRVLVVRLAALAVIAVVVPLLWKAMLWLPWEADCGIAGTAAFAFAYLFEREDAR